MADSQLWSAEPVPHEGEVFPLGDGRRIEIRPTTADDADRLAELYIDLPPVDLRKRFFSAWTPSANWCRQWASIGACHRSCWAANRRMDVASSPVTSPTCTRP
jgi:hypothetical protein